MAEVLRFLVASAGLDERPSAGSAASSLPPYESWGLPGGIEMGGASGGSMKRLGRPGGEKERGRLTEA